MSGGIFGFKSAKVLKSKLVGYSEDQSIDPQRYTTVQQLTGDKHGLDVVAHGVFKVTLSALTVEAGSNIRVIKATAHGASAGDQVRFILSGVEAAVLSTPDANTIILASELSFSPIGLTFDVFRHITPTYNSDGTIPMSAGPVQYSRKAAGVTLPVSVLEDLDTPAASKPLPVAIHSIDGAGITVNAGDLSVSVSHVNDSVAIGDGSTIAGVTASNELKTHDADSLAKLTSLEAKDFATQTTLLSADANLASIKTETTGTNSNTALIHSDLTTLNAKDFATSAKQEDIKTLIGTTNSTLSSANSHLSNIESFGATASNQATANSYLSDINVNLGAKADPVAGSDTGSFSLISLFKRWIVLGAKDASLTTISNGIGTSNSSLASIDGKIVLSVNNGIKSEIVNTSDIPVIQHINTAGSLNKGTVSTVTTITPVANAVGFIIKNHSASDGNLYWEIGGTATTDSNDLLPGQGSAFVPCVANISIISDSTAKYLVQWVVK